MNIPSTFRLAKRAIQCQSSALFIFGMMVLYQTGYAHPLPVTPVGETHTPRSLIARVVDPTDQGQSTDSTHQRRRLHIRGFAASITELSSINSKNVFSNGGQIAVLINRRIWLGAYGLTTVSNARDIVAEVVGASPGRYDKFTQVGGLLGYSFRPKRAVHVGVSSRLGAGFLNSGQAGALAAVAFVATPEVSVELNLRRWMRASLGAGYRFVHSNGPLTRQNALSSPTLALGLSFGWFD